MNSRSVQLGNQLCDQDKIILKLIDNRPVKYVGTDTDFAKHLNLSDSASTLILVINHPVWCSDVVKRCSKYLNADINEFYIGVNRYELLGNDTVQEFDTTNEHGLDYIRFLTATVQKLGYCVIDSGAHDADQGRYFNFIQPLTWIYGKKITNKSN